MVPNVVAPYLIMLTAFVAQAILAEASLSFLGLGVTEPTASWGLMLSGAAADFYQQAPWMIVFPGHRDQPRGVRVQPVRRLACGTGSIRRSRSGGFACRTFFASVPRVGRRAVAGAGGGIPRLRGTGERQRVPAVGVAAVDRDDLRAARPTGDARDVACRHTRHRGGRSRGPHRRALPADGGCIAAADPARAAPLVAALRCGPAAGDDRMGCRHAAPTRTCLRSGG